MGREQWACQRCGALLAQANSNAVCAVCRSVADGPGELPRDFWHDEQMIAALLSPGFGAVIRAFRLHPYWRDRPHPAQRRCWLSQELVAGWLSISQEKLSRIESGREPVWDLRDLDHYARVLGLPQPSACLGTLDGLTPCATDTPMEPLDRRALLSRAAALGLAALPAVPLPDVASKVDPERVERSLQMLGVLADQDNIFGPRAVVGAVRRELATTSRERQVARGTLRTELLRVEARWAEFAGWLSDDGGDAQAGDYWLDRAITMSQESGDRLMTSYILMRQSQRASERGHAQRTVALAQAAQRPRTLTVAVRALGAVREAEGHALTANAAACQSKLDEAHRLLDDRRDETVEEPFDSLGTHYMTHTYVTVHEAQCWTWLDRHDEAAATLSGALTSWPAALHRDAGLHRARLARACAADGEPDRAAHDGIAALEIACSTKSARIMSELGTLDRELSTHGALQAARDFRDAYAVASVGHG
jgi:tetratricopeptide (TPR) repeat protein